MHGQEKQSRAWGTWPGQTFQHMTYKSLPKAASSYLPCLNFAPVLMPFSFLGTGPQHLTKPRLVAWLFV